MDIRLNCHVTAPSCWQGAAMYTENISRRGLLIAWRCDRGPLDPPVEGQILSVEIELPAHHDFAPRCIHCEGIVSRVSSPEGSGPLVALRVNYMAFRSFHDRMRAMESLYPSAPTWMA